MARRTTRACVPRCRPIPTWTRIRCWRARTPWSCAWTRSRIRTTSAQSAGSRKPPAAPAEVTPAVCKASAGAVEHLRIARVRNLADWLGEAKRLEAWVYGAAADARVPYHRPDYSGRVVLVLGSEGRGLRPRVADACDEHVSLPISGKVGSLNVATAAAALVYGILQFRRRALDKDS